MPKSLTYPFTDKEPLDWGWTVKREGSPCKKRIDISCLELVPFHKEHERKVSGKEMLRRSKDKRAFPGCQGWSQHYAEDIIFEDRYEKPELPSSFREFRILFPDTILLDMKLECMPYIEWIDDDEDPDWSLNWIWIGDGFERDCRFLRLRRIRAPRKSSG